VYARFVGKKLIGSAGTLAFVVVFNFFLFRVVQNDPVGSMFRGRNVPQTKLDQMRADFGLDESMWTQFLLYLRQTAQLDFGLSYQSRQPVWDEITRKVWPTVLLVGVAAILSAVFGVIGGIIAAWRRGSAADYSITSSTMLFYSMPDFWLGMLLLVGFAVVLPWFPTGGWSTSARTTGGSDRWSTMPTTSCCRA
jgi:peptide/nickel transport system permease protein